MDTKCVRVLRPYKETELKNELFIDEEAREALGKNWDDQVLAVGRKTVSVIIKPLNEIDQNGFIARANSKLLDELFIEYGEEVLLY